VGYRDGLAGRGEKVRRRAPEIVALAAVLYGSFLRLEDLPGLSSFGDAFHATTLAGWDYARVLAPFDHDGSGIAVPLLQRLVDGSFGPSDWTYGSPAVLAGIAALVAIFPVAERLVGRNAAAIATLALALNPLHVFYSHFGRSSSLACLGGLLLVGQLRRVVDEPRVGLPGHVGIAITAALIPAIQPSALGVVIALGLGAMALLVRRGRTGRPLRHLALCFVAAAMLCLALVLPAWKSSWEFYSVLIAAGSSVVFGAIDIGRLMFGGQVAAWVTLLGVPFASLWMLRSGSDSAWLLAPAALLPVALLPIQSPVGSAVAYAHVLLPSIPFMLMIFAWAVVAFADRVHRDPRAATRLAISLGSGAIVLAHVAGPLGIAQPEGGLFANGTIPQPAQPRQEVRSQGTSDYQAPPALERGDVRIIEAPALVDPRALLYRNHYLPHRRDALVGFFAQRVGATGPYIPLLDAPQIRASGADYLVYHRDVEREARKYWETAPSVEREVPEVEPPAGEQLELLRKMLGEPDYESDDRLVWKLRAGETRE
jgi:hypothetical protein